MFVQMPFGTLSRELAQLFNRWVDSKGMITLCKKKALKWKYGFNSLILILEMHVSSSGTSGKNICV